MHILRSISFAARATAAMLFLASTAQAAPGWSLKRDDDGIKIYTRSVEGASDVKALRVTLTAPGTPALLAKVLMNIPGQKDWVYSTKSSKLLKKISDAEVIYYSEKSMPWPVTNRDAVMHLRIATAPATGVMTIRANTTDYPVAKKDGVIRVPSSSVAWRVTPTSTTEMKIEYEATLDPGGSVPAWVTNLFITKGPYETFKKLKILLAKG